MRKINVGDTFDVWWRVTSIERKENGHYEYTLENGANGMRTTLSESAMYRILDGGSSVSRAMFAKTGGFYKRRIAR